MIQIKDLSKPSKLETEKPLLKKFSKTLRSRERKKFFSYVIDEIENATYHETRRELLFNLKKALDRGGREELEKELLYMIDKPLPERKKR